MSLISHKPEHWPKTESEGAGSMGSRRSASSSLEEVPTQAAGGPDASSSLEDRGGPDASGSWPPRAALRVFLCSCARRATAEKGSGARARTAFAPAERSNAIASERLVAV